MSDSAGLSGVNGQSLTDWAHTQQSIEKILSTPIGTRLMRRTFGSDLPDLVDAKMTPKNILQVYSSAAAAIEKWEPRFRMTSGRIDEAAVSGRVSLAIHGTYFPRGHLGDYSIAQDAVTRVVFQGAI